MLSAEHLFMSLLKTGLTRFLAGMGPFGNLDKDHSACALLAARIFRYTLSEKLVAQGVITTLSTLQDVLRSTAKVEQTLHGSAL